MIGQTHFGHKWGGGKVLTTIGFISTIIVTIGSDLHVLQPMGLN